MTFIETDVMLLLLQVIYLQRLAPSTGKCVSHEFHDPLHDYYLGAATLSFHLRPLKYHVILAEQCSHSRGMASDYEWWHETFSVVDLSQVICM